MLAHIVCTCASHTKNDFQHINQTNCIHYVNRQCFALSISASLTICSNGLIFNDTKKVRHKGKKTSLNYHQFDDFQYAKMYNKLKVHSVWWLTNASPSQRRHIPMCLRCYVFTVAKFDHVQIIGFEFPQMYTLLCMHICTSPLPRAVVSKFMPEIVGLLMHELRLPLC